MFSRLCFRIWLGYPVSVQIRMYSRALAQTSSISYTGHITSTSNNRIKHCVKLRKSPSYRRQEKKVLLVGQTVISEQVGNWKASQVEALFICEHDSESLGEALDPALKIANEVISVEHHVLKKLSGVQDASSVRVVAEVAMPRNEDIEDLDWDNMKRVLVLDGIQDPGNLGTLLRNTEALAWDAVILLDGCCDIFNEKAVRAARGASFTVKTCRTSWLDFSRMASKHGFNMIAASASSEPVIEHEGQVNSEKLTRISQTQKVALALGSEGVGLQPEVLHSCHQVSIPISGAMESMNVAAAGSMLMLALSDALPNVLNRLVRLLDCKQV